MISRSPNVPAIVPAAGLKTQFIGSRKPSFRIARRICQRSNLALNERITELPKAGMARGLRTKRFFSASRIDSVAAFSF